MRRPKEIVSGKPLLSDTFYLTRRRTHFTRYGVEVVMNRAGGIYRFREYGDNAADVRRKARELARDFFACRWSREAEQNCCVDFDV